MQDQKDLKKGCRGKPPLRMLPKKRLRGDLQELGRISDHNSLIQTGGDQLSKSNKLSLGVVGMFWK